MIMKKVLFLSIALICLSTNVMAANTCATGEENCWACGTNCVARLDNTGTMTIKTIDTNQPGSMSNYSYGNAPWKNKMSDIKNVEIESKENGGGIKNVGNYAFHQATNLLNVTIPDSVTTIGKNSFWLTKSLTSLTIPNSVTSIGDYAFVGAEKVTSLEIPDSVQTMGKGAFNAWYGLTDLKISNSVLAIEHGTFYGAKITDLVIPDSVTKIGLEAFGSNKYLKNVVIPDSVTTIERLAFWGNSNLESIVIPDSVTSMGTEIFKGDYKLTDIYCSLEQQTMCETALTDSGLSLDLLRIYSKDSSGKYISNGKTYLSLSNMQKGVDFKPKRIYTVEEASKVSKPTGNKIMLRYK